MKFKVDENLPREVADVLQHAGHDASTVHDEALGGRADPVIAQVCRDEERILVTLDRGFGDPRLYDLQTYPGFLVLRPERQDKNRILDLLARTIPLFGSEPVEHRLWIVEETRVRIRPLDPA